MILLLVAAYALMGYLTVFIVEYTDPYDSRWDDFAPWGLAAVWPVAVIFIIPVILALISKRASFLSPVALAQAAKKHRADRKRVIVKGGRGLSDG